ncbi:MAG TPA: HTTM domain-containing protein [Prosthecobacter sp.]|nr:HTTM domain-containing protein [Prosthecobacter sp.]
MNSVPPFGLPGRIFLRTEDVRVYALMRIGFAGVALYNLILMVPFRHTLFSDAGMFDIDTAVEHSEMASVALFHWFHTPGQVTLLMGIVALSMLLLMAGILPRLAACIVFFWHLSYVERAPVGLTGWDMVLRAFSFLILVSPLGSAWNLRAWWRRAWPPPVQVARYGLVLMRLQVIVIYLQTALAKMFDVNPYWRDGEFLPYYLMSHNARWPHAWAAENADLLMLGTYVALVIECAIPLLLCIRRTRLWGALLGLFFHSLIAVVSRNLEPFLVVMMMSYLAFLNGRDLNRLHQWFTARRPPRRLVS